MRSVSTLIALAAVAGICYGGFMLGKKLLDDYGRSQYNAGYKAAGIDQMSAAYDLMQNNLNAIEDIKNEPQKENHIDADNELRRLNIMSVRQAGAGCN